MKSLEMEMAKARNELRCAQGDLNKINNRVAFVLSAIHAIKDMEK